jgi:acetyl esterase/lipase
MTTEDQSAGGERDGSLHVGPRSIPPPEGASDVARNTVMASALADPKPVVPIPQTVDEWLAFVAAAQEPAIALARSLEQDLAATVEHDQIAGVDVYHVIPDEISPAHEDHLFVHVHGGAYILNGGPACVTEALVLATGIGIRAASIDYRMAPLHPYPAPVDDVVAVYVELLQRHRARSMVMGGSSAGGGLTLSAVQRLLQDGIRVPGALFIGTSGSDLSGSGDSVHINHDVDRNIPEWAGLVAAMCECHAAGIDMADTGSRRSTANSTASHQPCSPPVSVISSSATPCAPTPSCSKQEPKPSSWCSKACHTRTTSPNSPRQKLRFSSRDSTSSAPATSRAPPANVQAPRHSSNPSVVHNRPWAGLSRSVESVRSGPVR